MLYLGIFELVLYNLNIILIVHTKFKKKKKKHNLFYYNNYNIFVSFSFRTVNLVYGKMHSSHNCSYRVVTFRT